MKLKITSYEEDFEWAKNKMEQYPNCEEYISSLYIHMLDSGDEIIRIRAADSLIGFYMRKGQHEKTEECLQYLSIQNPERKRKKAQIYSETVLYEHMECKEVSAGIVKK